MNFKEIGLSNHIDSVETTEKNDTISDTELYNFELDFIEKYEDDKGILHIKTIFNHEDIPECDLWEVFLPEDGSHPLELLLKPDREELFN